MIDQLKKMIENAKNEHNRNLYRVLLFQIYDKTNYRRMMKFVTTMQFDKNKIYPNSCNDLTRMDVKRYLELYLDYTFMEKFIYSNPATECSNLVTECISDIEIGGIDENNPNIINFKVTFWLYHSSTIAAYGCFSSKEKPKDGVSNFVKSLEKIFSGCKEVNTHSFGNKYIGYPRLDVKTYIDLIVGRRTLFQTREILYDGELIPDILSINKPVFLNEECWRLAALLKFKFPESIPCWFYKDNPRTTHIFTCISGRFYDWEGKPYTYKELYENDWKFSDIVENKPSTTDVIGGILNFDSLWEND